MILSKASWHYLCKITKTSFRKKKMVSVTVSPPWLSCWNSSGFSWLCISRFFLFSLPHCNALLWSSIPPTTVPPLETCDFPSCSTKKEKKIESNQLCHGFIKNRICPRTKSWCCWFYLQISGATNPSHLSGEESIFRGTQVMPLKFGRVHKSISVRLWQKTRFCFKWVAAEASLHVPGKIFSTAVTVRKELLSVDTVNTQLGFLGLHFRAIESWESSKLVRYVLAIWQRLHAVAMVKAEAFQVGTWRGEGEKRWGKRVERIGIGIGIVVRYVRGRIGEERKRIWEKRKVSNPIRGEIVWVWMCVESGVIRVEVRRHGSEISGRIQPMNQLQKHRENA